MKIGFNQATALGCKGQSLMEDLQACEKHAFDYIEIRFDCLKDYLKEHSLDDLAAWFKSRRLKPWAYNTLLFFNLRDAAGEKEIDRELDFIIRVSKAIGMKTLITVPSFDVGPFSIAEIHSEAVSRLNYLAGKAADHDLRISLEFCGCHNCSINQFGAAWEVVKAVDRENVGITLDAFHFHAMGSNWEDLEKADGKKIFAFHLNDSENLPIGSLMDANRLWPGDGCLDLKRTFKTLKKIGFDGVCSIEEFRPEYYLLEHDENIRIAKEKTLEAITKYF
jgi:2-keto-myo-inositol isomerase